MKKNSSLLIPKVPGKSALRMTSCWLPLVLGASISIVSTQAATSNWILDNTGSWGLATNWSAGVPNSAGDIVNFTNNITAARTVTLEGTRTMGTLRIGDSDSNFAFTLSGIPNGGGLVFDNLGSQALLDISSGAAISNTITAPISLKDDLRIAITGASTGTHAINGVISGAKAVVLDANGQAAANAIGGVQLNGINTFTGGLTTTQVRVQAGNALALGTGLVTVNSTGQIYASGAGVYANNMKLTGLGWQEATGLLGALRSDTNNTFNGNIEVAQAGAVTTTRFNTHTTGTITNVINGVVSGNANVEFTKSAAAGTSTWVLSNDATYAGTTLVGLNAGGTGTSVLQLGNNTTTGSINAASAVTLGAGGTLGFNRSNAMTFTNTVTGAGNVSNSGVGTITWDNGTSGYTGTTAVSGTNGKLVFGTGGAYTFSGTGNIALSNGADIEFNTSSNLTLSQNITGTDTNPLLQTFTIWSGSGTLTLTGAGNNAGNQLWISNGTVSLNKTAASVYSFGGSNQIGAYINGGTLKIDSAATTDQIWANSDIKLDAGTFDLNGKSDGFDVLTGNGGTVTNNGGVLSTLTLGENNSGTNNFNGGGLTAYKADFAGVIQDGTSPLALIKAGTGSQTLSGANTFTGGTTISAGTLVVNGSLKDTAAVNVNTGGTLSGTGMVGNIVLATGGTIRPGQSGADNQIGALVANSLTVNGGDIRANFGDGSNDQVLVIGNATFAAASTITPTVTNILPLGSYSVVQSAGGTVSGTMPTLTMPATTRSTFAVTSDPTNIFLNVSGAVAKSLTWSGTTNGNWNLNSTANWNAGADTFYNLDAVTFGDGPTNRTITLSAGLVPTTITVNNSTGNDYIFQTGTLTGGGTSITKTGSGVLTVSTANTFSGPVTITSGTFKNGNATALGDGNGETFVSGGGTFDINGVTNNQETINISGAGVGGAGALVNNSATTATAGKFLRLTSDATIGGTGRIDFNVAGGSVDLAGYKLTKVGTNIVYLGNAVPVTSGDIDVQGGTLGFAFALGAVNGTGTITYNPGTTGWFYQIPAGGVTRPIVVNGATLATQDQNSILNSPITLTGNLTIDQNGNTFNLAGPITESGGARNVTKTAAGTVTLTGPQGYTGALAVNGGVLQIGNGTGVNFPSVSGINLAGGGTLQVNQLGNTAITVPVTIASNGGTLRQIGATQNSTLTINNTVGSSTSFGTLATTQGTTTLASGANVNVNFVQVGLTTISSGNVGTMNIQPGASVNTFNFYLGDQSGFSGIVNQTGGTVNVIGNDTSDGAVRIGHWPGQQSAWNISAGSLSVPNGNIAIGIDGNSPVLNVSGTAAVSAFRLAVDGRGASVPIGGFLYQSGGEISIGAGGIIRANTGAGNASINLSGGTLSSTATSTWAVGLNYENNASTIDTNGNTVTISGAVVGAGGFTKVDNGVLILSNADNNLNGTLNVNGGQLSLTGNLTGAATVNTASGGALVVTGAQTTTAAINLNAGGILSGNGNGTTTGRVGNLTLNAGGSLRAGASFAEGSFGTLAATTLNFNGGDARLDLNPTVFTTGGGTNDLIAVNGAMTLNGGTVTPVWNSTPSAGTYTIITSTGVTNNTMPTISATAASRQTYSLAVSGNNLQLTVAGTSANLVWNGTLSGNSWDTNSTSNWQLATPNDEKFLAYDNVSFTNAGSNSPNVNLGAMVLPGSTTVDATQNYTFTGAGGIGSGSLTKSNTGTLILENNNVYGGTTTINAGVLQLGTGGTSGSIGAGNIVNNSSLVVNRSDATTLPNLISGTGTLSFTGGGTLTLGVGTSTFSGGTTLSAGTLTTAQSSTGGATPTSGPFGTGAIVMGDATSGSNPLSLLLINSADVGNAVTVSNLGTGLVTLGAGNIGIASNATSLLGTVTLNRPVTITAPALIDRFTLDGKVTGSVGTLTVTGGGRTTLVNTGNDFVGDVSITQVGTNLQLGVNSAAEVLPNASSVTMVSGTTFTLAGTAGTTETMNALIGTGTVTRAVAGFQTLTLGSANGSGSFGGVIQNGTGVISLTKSGSGTQVLSGSVNSTGSITINGGVLEITNTNGFGGGVGVSGRPAVKAAQTTDTTLDTTITTTGSTADLVIGMSISGTGIPAGSRILTIPTATTVTIAGTQSATLAGNLTFGAAPMLLNGGTFRYSGAAATDDRYINVNTAGGTIEASGTGALTLNAPLQFTNTGTRTLTFSGTNTANNTFSGIIADNTGATTIAKDGAGVWLLSGVNTYTGGTNILNGILKAGNNAAFGANNSVVTVSNGATLDVNGLAPGTSRYEVKVSGAGVSGLAAIWNGGAGVTNSPIYNKITLLGDATIGGVARYDLNGGTGGVTFNGGTFTLTKVGVNETWWAPNAGATVGDVVVNAGIFGLQNGATPNLGSTAHSLIINSAGTVYTYGGGGTASNDKPVSINSGVLGANNGVGLWTGQITLLGSGTSNRIDPLVGTQVTLNGKITGVGGFEKRQPGILEISNSANDYAGDTLISAGTVNLTGAALGEVLPNTTNVTVATGSAMNLNSPAGSTETIAALNGSGNISRGIAGDEKLIVGSNNASGSYGGVISNGSGSVSFGKTGSGTQTLTGISTFTGSTTVSAGSLALSASGNISGSTSVIVDAGAFLDVTAKSGGWDVAGKAVTVNGNLMGSVIVNAGSVLGGSGTISNLVTMNAGTISPGNSPGILTTSGLTTTGGSINFEMEGVTAGNGTGFADQLNVLGNVNLSGTTAVFSFTNGYTGFDPVTPGTAFFLIKNDGVDPIVGAFANVAEGSPVTIGSFTYTATYTADAESGNLTGGNDFALIPEPSSVVLCLLPLAFGLRRRRR